VTWQDYGVGLDGNPADLKDRLHRGSYRAQPSRRHFIAKADGRLRPLGIAALGINSGKVNWILDADIRAFFDSISHAWMMKFLEHRIGDRRILRVIRKWLTVGILDEDGKRQPATVGNPQGAVISPLPATTSTPITYTICGPGNGGGAMRPATCWSYGMPNGSLRNCDCAWRSLHWNFIRIWAGGRAAMRVPTTILSACAGYLPSRGQTHTDPFRSPPPR
jgi:hypothetical protein